MNLSADLIYECLSEKYDAEYYGRDSRLLLHNILFYRTDRPLRQGSIYLVREEIAPPEEAEKDFVNECLFIFVNASCDKSLFPDGIPFILMKKADIFDVSNDLWSIFDYYTNWDRSMEKISHASADIPQMLLQSAPVLGNPLAAVNSRKELLGAVWHKDNYPAAKALHPVLRSGREQAELTFFQNDETDTEDQWYLIELHDVPLEYADRMRILEDENHRTRQPFLNHDTDCDRVYGINLFIQDSYAGSLSMTEACTPFTQSRFELLRHLAGHVEESVRHRTYEEKVHITPIKRTLWEILTGGNTYEEHLAENIAGFFQMDKTPDGWLCAVFRPDDDVKLATPEYLISIIADIVDPSISFSYNEEIVTLICNAEVSHAVERLEKLLPLVGQLSMRIGLSDAFTSLTDLGLAYRKAECAIEARFGINRRSEVQLFTSNVLTYMLGHACGDFTMEELYSPGIRRLIQHDAVKEVSYIDTLRCYLENEQNMLRTSRCLFLHRSSLEQRMEHIFKLLGSRLNDPDERLYLMMILRMMEGSPTAPSTSISEGQR